MEIDFTPILVGWLGAAIAGGLGAYFGAYLSRKGENLATKEDIADITKLQEGVRHDFQSLTERMRAVESMRMAVVEKRFEAHQQAYALWLHLIKGVYGPDNLERARKCDAWWCDNGLYLDPEPRAAFKEAYISASTHKEIPRNTPEDRNEMKESWRDIVAAGPIIERAVNLPPLGEIATKGLVSDAGHQTNNSS